MCRALPMLDPDEIAVTILSTSIEGIGNLDVPTNMPVMFSGGARFSSDRSDDSFKSLFGDNGVFGIHDSENKMLCQVKFNSAY